MGTTSEKLTYLNTTKTLIKEELNLGGANITNEPFRAYKDKLEGIYKDFLANGTDTLWNNWLPKVSGSGETITLNNTIEAKMDFVYKGNTYQYSTTGKNLQKIPTTTTTYNGITFTPMFNENGTLQYINVNGTATAVSYIDLPNISLSAGTYIMTGSPSGGSDSSYQQRFVAGEMSYGTDNGNGVTLNLNAGGSYHIRIRIASGYTANNLKFYPMVRLSSITDATYEPYTNGASPNPDYPQDIQVVSGDNSITIANNDNTQSQTYPISLGDIELCKIGTYQDSIKKSTGKNLFEEWISGTINIQTGEITSVARNITDYIEVKPNTNYTIWRENTGFATYFVEYNENKGFIREQHISSATTTGTFTTSATTKYVILYQYTSYSPTNKAMFNIGSTALPYEPYGKVWYLNKQIGKVVYNGSESGSWTPSVNGGFTRFAGPYISNAQQTVSRLQMKSNYFHYLSSGNEIGGGFIYAGQFFAYPNQTITTEQNFRDWLSTHNTIVYYVLATPTYEEITDTTLISQLEAIKKSYNTQTNISQTNNDMPFELDVVALGELEI